MPKSNFDLDYQNADRTSKIVVGLSRISEAFKSLLWDHAKSIGLSPIQIQILIFVSYHKDELNTISYLANEFNVTKATISDATKTLENKGLVLKDFTSSDRRSYTIKVSDAGRLVVKKTDTFAKPIETLIKALPNSDQETLLSAIISLVTGLNESNILRVQRSCFVCQFYTHSEDQRFCNFLNKPLKQQDIRLDCAEFQTQ